MPHEPDKSIGAEETFATDVDDPAVIARELLRLSERTAARLRASGQVGRTVSIKIRFADFTTITRARTLPEATDVGRTVYETALALYEALGLERARLRLVGVRVEGISDAASSPRQLLLGEREHRLARGRAGRRPGGPAVRRRRGASAPATLVDPAVRQPASPGTPRDEGHSQAAVRTAGDAGASDGTRRGGAARSCRSGRTAQLAARILVRQDSGTRTSQPRTRRPTSH